ncbi:hypothetical protein Tco_1048642, partial [Tanacetum coccineum]
MSGMLAFTMLLTPPSNVVLAKVSGVAMHFYWPSYLMDAINSSADVYSTSYANAPSKETFIRHKAKRSHVVVSKEVIPKIKSVDIVGSHSATYEGLNANSPHESITSAQDGVNASNMETKRCPPKKSHMLIK